MIVVPAQPGEIAYFIWVDSPIDEPPTIENVIVNHYYVIAWKIKLVDDWLPEPIFMEQPSASQDAVYHLMPDGKVCSIQDQILEDLESAKHYELDRAIQKWEASKK